jgi:hypothetical protein
MVNIFLKLFRYEGIIIFINNNHKKEQAISHLLNMVDKKCIYVYRKAPIYSVTEKKFILNNFFFFLFSLILGIKLKNKIIIIFSQPYYAFPYIILGPYINVYFYDVHVGLLYTPKIKLRIEKISIFFFKNIIHRDLRLWVEYKKILKNTSRKNLLIPDFVFEKKLTISKKNNNLIKCAVIGWVDDKFIKIDKSLKILTSLGVEIYFFTSEDSYKLVIKDANLDSKLLKKIHYVGYLENEALDNFLKDFSLGLCPHDSIKPKISKNYKQYCSSMRIINYLENFLTVFLSNKTIFQRFILKKYNANYYDIDSLKLLHTSNDLKSKILYKNIHYDNSIFNKNKLSQKLIRFLNF